MTSTRPHIVATLILSAAAFCCTAMRTTAASADEFAKRRAQFDEQYDAGEYAAAEKTARVLLRLAERSGSGASDRRGTALQSLAVAIHDQGRLDEAEKAYRACLAVRQKELGPEHRDVAWTLFLLGWCLEDDRRADEAEAYYRQAAAIQEKVLGAGSQSLGRTLVRLGDLLDDAGRSTEAAAVYQKALRAYEASLGKEDKQVASVLNDLGWEQCRLAQFDQAQASYDRALAIYTGLFGEEDERVANVLGNMAVLARARDRFDEAERLHLRVLAIRRKLFGDDSEDVAQTYNNLGVLLCTVGRYAAAEESHRKALAIREKIDPQSLDTGVSLQNLAEVYRIEAKTDEALQMARRALAIYQRELGPEHPDVGWIYHNLGLMLQHQSRFDEAEAHYKRSLAILTKVVGPDHPDLPLALNNVAALYHDRGRYGEAEEYYRRALKIREANFGADHSEVAESLHNLAILYEDLGRYAEAEPLLERALAIEEATLGPEHARVASALNSLGNLHSDQGRMADAERMYRRSLAIRRKVLGDEHPDVGETINNLAILAKEQHRYAEASDLYRQSLAIREAAHGRKHALVADSLNNLATLYTDLGHYAEAETLHREALAIRRELLGDDHPNVAASLNNLALLAYYQDRLDEAEQLQQLSIAVKEKVLGAEHPDLASSYFNLALVCESRQQFDEAETLVDRTLRILEGARIDPVFQYQCYALRARLAWAADRRNEAVADLRRAMELAEWQRAHAGGAERERAGFFTSFAWAFEQMVAWQTELGDLNQALDAIERGRARSLLDEMQMVGADLQAGRPAVERERLLRKETELKSRIAALEVRLRESQDPAGAEAARLRGELVDARDALYRHWRDERAASPVYRNLLSTGAGTPRLSRVRRTLVQQDGLLLVYLIGQEGGYLLSAGPKDARLVKLTVDERAAEALGIEPGPLTAERLNAALMGGDGRGLIAQLADPKATVNQPGLAALWEVLIPAAERELLVGGKVSRLMIVPDGPLALLPFDALVVQQGESPKFLLDVGPPTLYSPSTTVLVNLMERPRSRAPSDREPVLTLGDPSYSPAEQGPQAIDQLAERSRDRAPFGHLAPLPYSGRESTWVSETLQAAGWDSLRLAGPEATEANLRAEITGRTLVHLACHGMADQAYGNFFGGLALAPGRQGSNPNDDGFLTLSEIYELNLTGCELLILSACQTNFGPQQQGEGVWALSRGFLIAGSRRVVASNWLVDDEAAASLVSYFCGGVAAAEKQQEPVDFARALHEAKRWVRKQQRWESPYYWGTFVLVGPQ